MGKIILGFVLGVGATAAAHHYYPAPTARLLSPAQVDAIHAQQDQIRAISNDFAAKLQEDSDRIAERARESAQRDLDNYLDMIAQANAK